MLKQPMSADNLFLLGELLQGAGEYVTRSKHHADDEDSFMIELAREQIPHLKLALRNLDHSLTELDGHLKKMLGTDPKASGNERKQERRHGRAASGK